MKFVQFKIGSFGGAENFFFKTLKAFDELGHEQYVVHNEHPQMRERAIETGLPRTELAFPKKKLALASRMKLRQIVAREKPDVFFCWANRAGRRAFRSTKFVTVARLGGFYRAKNYSSVQHLICNTPAIVDHMVKQGWNRQNISMISNFGELEQVPAASRADLNVPEDAFVLLSMGRFDEWKGFQDVIAALRQLPDNVYYCIAGDGENMEAWKQLANELGVADRVRFLGWRTDQAALLAACDLCVVPSRHEPLSNVTVEAWSLGVPVLAARSEGPSWLIDHGKTGLLVPLEDPDALASSIKEVMHDKATLASLGQAGHAKWQGNFSKQEICGQYIDLFERLQKQNANRKFFALRLKAE